MREHSKPSGSKRPYRQSTRAVKAAETAERMLSHAEQLFAIHTFDRVTLAAVAEAAQVTLPTVQRAFGTKLGLFDAVAARVRERVLQQRTSNGLSVDESLDALLDHYEREGALMWHLLRQESEVPALQIGLAEARQIHRTWVEEVFRSSLSGLRASNRRRRVDTLVAATDLYLWKLLRIDLGRGRAETRAAIGELVVAVSTRSSAASSMRQMTKTEA